MKTHERIHSGRIQFKSAQSVTSVFNIKFLEGSWEDPHRGEAFQMLKMWQELLEIGPLKRLWEDQNRREAFQMFKVWQKLDPHRMIFRWSKCNKSFSIAGHLKEHANTYGREAFQMLKVWQELLKIGPLKELWEDPHGRETFQMFKVWQKLLEIRPLSKPTVGWSGQPHYLLTQKCNIKT